MNKFHGFQLLIACTKQANNVLSGDPGLRDRLLDKYRPMKTDSRCPCSIGSKSRNSERLVLVENVSDSSFGLPLDYCHRKWVSRPVLLVRFLLRLNTNWWNTYEVGPISEIRAVFWSRIFARVLYAVGVDAGNSKSQGSEEKGWKSHFDSLSLVGSVELSQGIGRIVGNLYTEWWFQGCPLL